MGDVEFDLGAVVDLMQQILRQVRAYQDAGSTPVSAADASLAAMADHFERYLTTFAVVCHGDDQPTGIFEITEDWAVEATLFTVFHGEIPNTEPLHDYLSQTTKAWLENKRATGSDSLWMVVAQPAELW